MLKYSVKFDLYPQKNSAGLTENRPIRMRVAYSGNRVELRVGYSVDSEKWDSSSERAVRNTKNRYNQTANEINKAIENCQDVIDNLFIRFEQIDKKIPTPAELRDAFNNQMGRVKPVIEEVVAEPRKEEVVARTFFEVFDEFTATMGRMNSWTTATYTKFNSIRLHLHNYNPDLPLNDLTDLDLQGFIESLQASDLRNTTISKYIGFVRWFLRWAYGKDYYNGKLHESFRPKLKGIDGNSKEVIHLTWKELLHLLDFEFPENRPSLPAVRDVFCFCCFTGLRYSDVAKLRRSDVRDNCIKVVTQKTIDGLTIELNDYSRAILDKYKDVKFSKNLALPVISNAKMNEHLKVMGELAGLDEPQRIVFFKGNQRHEMTFPKYALLTSHCGRRTFIVIALYLGISAEVVMKWTGHSDFKAMKPYVKIIDELKVQEMTKFNKKRE